MKTIEKKKVVTISNTDSVYSKLIIAAKHIYCSNWEKWQEKICENMGLKQEVKILERVAKAFGMNPTEYDNKPLHVFIDNIWREAKNYTITVDTTLQ